MTQKTLLVTGGAGFIGTNFIRNALTVRPDWRIVNLDALTYAGNLSNFMDLSHAQTERHRFVHGDIRDSSLLERLFSEESFNSVVHFAAESHVDRSILGPEAFLETNVLGTFCLLDASLKYWRAKGEPDNFRFLHISTDEVYGSLGSQGYFTERTPYDPSSPYSASKASSDHFVKAYFRTYGLPTLITNCSNNYGPYQFPEKLIPLIILNILERNPLPVYGDGKNVRDWLHVDDHNSAIWTILQKGLTGRSYNIGGENEWENIHLVEVLCDKVALALGRNSDKCRDLITFVKDRPGHDLRYAINCSRIKEELGWSQCYDFNTGIDKTIEWYMNNSEWINNVKSGEYRKWIECNYDRR